ncbi:glycoside hydrolase family 18 protein [Luteimonas cucumeris]|nr:glycosyl hydrolase family 18 protein [Luteimonas cucumeris]
MIRSRRRSAGALLGLLLLTASCIVAAHDAPRQPRIVGYATGWNAAQERNVDQLDMLIFSFAKVSDDRVVLDDDAAQRLQTLVALKERHPKLRIAIAIGGWGAGGFSEAASTEAGRRAFADTAAELLAMHRADGLDVDWEYPGFDDAGIKASPDDRENFTRLIEAVRASLDRVGAREGRSGDNRYTLSIAVADGRFVRDIDIAAVEPHLDWFNLMTYDFVNSMTPTTGHHAGLHAATQAPADARSADRAVRQFLGFGVPARKLLIGAAFYGREFGDVQPRHQGRYQSFGRYVGEHPWPKLKAEYVDKQGYVRHWDETAQAPWLWNAETRHFITYDDPQSLAAKAAFVKAQQLGGIMYWEQVHDTEGELLDALAKGLR